MRTEREIEKLIDRAAKAAEVGSKFPGMSYEEGVIAALEWALGDDIDPMED